MTTTTTTTTMITRRGKFSTASSVLVLCAMLLMTKSCGIVAFSGDGSGALVGGADAWSGFTTTTEAAELQTSTMVGWSDTTEAGSGVQTTTDVNDESIVTTLAPVVEPVETTTTTEGPGEEGSGNGSSTSPSEVTTTESPVTTTEANGNGTELSTTTEEQAVPTTEAAAITSTTEAAAIATTIEPTPPAPQVFECQAAGLFAHISGDCQLYHSCLRNPLSGQLVASEQLCPPLTVFSSIYERCTRDLSPCIADGFNCTILGRFPGIDDSYYYSCVPSLLGGFHKYFVRCSSGERFEPALGRCWRYSWTHLIPGEAALEASDLAAIKREQKQFKAEDKLRQKAQKQQDKLLRKQQKELEKQAQKLAKEQAKQQAKEQAKAEKEKNKGKQGQQSVESAQSEEDEEQQSLEPQPENFQCSREGNFSRVDPRQYFACVTQNGKLLTLPMQCSEGQAFNALRGVCQAQS